MPYTIHIVQACEDGLKGLELRGYVVRRVVGFLLGRRDVYQTLQEKLELPACIERFGRPMVSYFQPMPCEGEGGHWYLAEDYAFCERARRCGFKIIADTTIRLRHFGTYGYACEDAGVDRPRHGTVTLKFGGKA